MNVPFVATAAALAALLGAATASAQTVTREKVDTAIPKIEALAQSLVDKGEVPGLAIGIVFEDQVVYLGGFGVREVGKADKVDADTVFQLASLSKPISATVVAALISDSGGAMSWDSKVADLDPVFRLSQPYPSEQLTLTDLFSHRSGLPGNAGNDLEGIGFDRTVILDRLRLVPPASSFRAGYSYSNFGLTEGGVAAAAGAGMSWEEAAEEKLFKPLGMTSTSARHDEFLTRKNRAALHILVDGQWTPKVKRNPDPQAPAGGASGNVRDLAKWLLLEVNNGMYDGRQVISAEALAATHEPVIMRGTNPFTGEAGFYARGWNVDYGRHGTMWSHAGAFSNGARTEANILPAEKLGIVVLAAAFPTGVPEGIADTFFDEVIDGRPSRDWVEAWNGLYDSLFGAEVIEAAGAAFAKPPENATAPLALSAYTGAYANDYVGEAVVTEEGGALMLALGPDGVKRFPLRHFDRDTFVFAMSEEYPDLMSPAVFAIGPDGTAASLAIDDFAVAGAAVLPRKAE